MKRVSELLILDSIKNYRAAWNRRAAGDLLVEAFACWLELESNAPANAGKLAEGLRGRSGAKRNYRDVAASGFLVASSPTGGVSTAYFREGLIWLTQRKATFEHVPTGIAVDGIALLGVAVGVIHLGDASLVAKVRDWFTDFLAASLAFPRIPLWQKIVMRAAGGFVGVVGVNPTYEKESSDVCLALLIRGVVKSPTPDEPDMASEDFLMLLRHNPESDLEPERLALRLTAFKFMDGGTSTIARSKRDPMANPSKNRPTIVKNDEAGHLAFAWLMLQRSISAVPASKYFLGVVGIAAALSLVGALVLYNWKVAFVGGIAIFIGGVVVVVFANLARLKSGHFQMPALVLTWLSIGLVSATAVCLFTSVFWGRPLDLRRWLDDKAMSSRPELPKQTIDEIWRMVPDKAEVHVLIPDCSPAEFNRVLGHLQNSIEDKNRFLLVHGGGMGDAETKAAVASLNRGEEVKLDFPKPDYWLVLNIAERQATLFRRIQASKIATEGMPAW